MSRPCPSDKSVGSAAQLDTQAAYPQDLPPTLAVPLHGLSTPHQPWSPLPHSSTLRRRAVSVRSFPLSFLSPGCTGFTLRAAAAAPSPTIVYDCCNRPHSSSLVTFAHSVCTTTVRPCNLRADHRLSLVVIFGALYFDRACFVSLLPRSSSVVAVLH